MHWFLSSYQSCSKMEPNGLMPQTNTQDWDFTTIVRNYPEQVASIVGLFRSRRYNQSTIVLAGHAFQSDVVSNHLALNIQLVQIIEQVVGERIIVVDYKDHATADSELSVPESKKSLANGIKVET